MAGLARGFALVVLLACAGGTHAQDVVATAGASRTGDAAMDARLADIDAYGARYREAFVDELVRYHAAPRALVGTLLADEDLAPGDAYYACAVAQAVGRPCRYVLDLWRGAQAEGWDALSTRLGVAPGSADFQAILEGIEASYRRWGRPLPPPPAPVEPQAPAQGGG